MSGSGAHTPPTCPPLPAFAPDRRSRPRARRPPASFFHQEIGREYDGSIPPPDRDPGSPNSSFPWQTIHPRPTGSADDVSRVDRFRRAFAVRDFPSDTPGKSRRCVRRRALDRSGKRRQAVPVSLPIAHRTAQPAAPRAHDRRRQALARVPRIPSGRRATALPGKMFPRQKSASPLECLGTARPARPEGKQSFVPRLSLRRSEGNGNKDRDNPRQPTTASLPSPPPTSPEPARARAASQASHSYSHRRTAPPTHSHSCRVAVPSEPG